MVTRRSFLAAGAALALPKFAKSADKPRARKKMAMLTTEWRYRSHA